jgi:hypothetical protein
MSLKSGAFTPITCQELRRALHRTSEELASMWLEDAREPEGTLQPYLKPLFLNIAVPREV